MRIRAFLFSSEDRAWTITRKGGEQRAATGKAISSAEVLQGEMINSNAVHLLKECDTFHGAWQGIYFKICLSVALIFQEVWRKINVYLLNISYRIKFSISFFILLQSA